MLRSAALVTAIVLLGACGADTPGPAAAAESVVIKDFKFPATIEVDAGGTISWANQDDFAHTVKADDGSFDSMDIDAGSTFAHTFDDAGTYSYYCNIHNYMKGMVVVS